MTTIHQELKEYEINEKDVISEVAKLTRKCNQLLPILATYSGDALVYEASKIVSSTEEVDALIAMVNLRVNTFGITYKNGMEVLKWLANELKKIILHEKLEYLKGPKNKKKRYMINKKIRALGNEISGDVTLQGYIDKQSDAYEWFSKRDKQIKNQILRT